MGVKSFICHSKVAHGFVMIKDVKDYRLIIDSRYRNSEGRVKKQILSSSVRILT